MLCWTCLSVFHIPAPHYPSTSSASISTPWSCPDSRTVAVEELTYLPGGTNNTYYWVCCQELPRFSSEICQTLLFLSVAEEGRWRSNQQRACRICWQESRSVPAGRDSISGLVRFQIGKASHDQRPASKRRSHPSDTMIRWIIGNFHEVPALQGLECWQSTSCGSMASSETNLSSQS